MEHHKIGKYQCLQEENMAPTLETAFQDLIEEEGFGSVQVSYAGAFTDTDGHTLNISVESSDNDVVTVEVVANNQIEIAEVGVGTSTHHSNCLRRFWRIRVR